MSDFLGRFDQWSIFWSESLWRASLQGGIAIAAAWVIVHWCRFLSARVRCWAWRLACLKLLVALVWNQSLNFAVLPAEPAARPATIAARTNSPQPPRASEGRSQESAAASIPPIVRPAQIGASEMSLTTVLLLLWGSGAAYGMVRTARRFRAIVRLRRQTEPVQSGAWLRDLRDEADRIAVRRLPQLCFSEQADNVQLVGIWRPAIILPEDSLESLSDEERRLVLAHELAHLKRRDLAWNWLAAVARCLFFFHPLVWILVRGWCRAQEAACDELVIQGTVARRASYGRLLLKMSTRWPDKRQNALVAAGISGSYRQLEQRILAMAQVKPHSTPKLAAAAAATLLIVIGGVIPWRLVAQEPARPVVPDAQIGTPLNIAQAQNGRVTTYSYTSTFGLSADAASRSSSSGVVLPGKLYLRASVEIKTQNGATGKYAGMMVVDPNSGEWERLDADGFAVRVAPQGDRLAFSQITGMAARSQAITRILTSDLRARNVVEVAKDARLPIWSRDGKRLLFSRGTYTKDDHSQNSAWVLDLADKQVKKLPIPETDEVDDWTRDGEWVVTVSNRQPPFGHGYQLYVMHPDGTHERRITDGHGLNCYPRFRPGTNQISYHHQTHDFDSLWLVNLDGTNRKQLLTSDKNGAGAPQDACCWSPDGNWLAVVRFDWQTEVPGVANPKHERTYVPGLGNERLEIIAADGTSHGVLQLKDVTKVEWMANGDWR